MKTLEHLFGVLAPYLSGDIAMRDQTEDSPLTADGQYYRSIDEQYRIFAADWLSWGIPAGWTFVSTDSGISKQVGDVEYRLWYGFGAFRLERLAPGVPYPTQREIASGPSARALLALV